MILFMALFIIVMFRVLSVVYKFNIHQTLMVLFIPFLLGGLALLGLELIFPGFGAKFVMLFI